MTRKLLVTLPTIGSRIVIFGSPVAGLLGVGDKLNLALTLDPKTIHVEQMMMHRDHLGHEWGHGPDAERLGPLYVPWVLWHYGRHGTKTSKPETNADAWYAVNYAPFLNLPWIITPDTKLSGYTLPLTP